MTGKAQSRGMDDKNDQHERQDMEIKERLKHIKNKIIVMSGKGGVGKSSVAAYLAVSLAKRGLNVGLMDVDLHGPSIPRLLGLKGTIGRGSREGKARPVQFMPNMEVISIEPLMGEDKDAATIWRGPLKIGVIRQFISDIEWQDLDYMIVDSPPGTGDEPLTVAQTIPDAKALIVTTPQELSLADVRKSINFCRQVNMDILGIVENMSSMICPHCGKEIGLFSTGGGRSMAEDKDILFLGSLPIEPEVVKGGDSGNMSILDDERLSFSKALKEIVDRALNALEQAVPSSRQSEEAAPTSKTASGLKGRVIGVPVSDGKLSSHFGHSEQFAFIETEDGKIKATRMQTPPQHEPGVLPRWLHEQGVSIVIAGGIGERARQILVEKGIEVITGAPMDTPESLVNQYLSESLLTGENVCHH